MLFLWSHSRCSALALAHFCSHAALQCLAFQRGGGRWLGLPCSLGMGRGTYAAGTFGMCRECLHQKRPRRNCYGLGQGLRFPRGIDPRAQIPRWHLWHRLPGRCGQWPVPAHSLGGVGQLSCPPPGSGLRLSPPLVPVKARPAGSECMESQRPWPQACLSGESRLFPGQLCCTCALRLTSWQFSPWGLASEPESQHQPPPASEGRETSISGWGCCQHWSLQNSLHSAGCTPAAALSPEVLKLPPAPLVRGFLSVWILFLLHSSLLEAQVPSRFPCLSIFFFVPSFSQPGCVEISLPLLEIWSLLPAFSRCSVEVVPHAGVFFFFKIYLFINR